MDNDYLLLDLPYHCNLGDTLIWQGEKDYLSTLPYRCLYRTSCGGNVAKAFKKISKETIILLHGGGNFGDLWPLHNAFRKKAHEMFPHQKTIILPQSVYYKSQGKLEEDADFYMRYPNVTICARDRVSFEILTQYFPNNPKLLVPDMAFCMEMNSYRHIANPEGIVFIKRLDKEINETISYQEFPDDVYVSDWLFLSDSKEYARLGTVKRWATRYDKLLGTDWKHSWVDYYWDRFLRPLFVNAAINFLDKYKHIYTTRMHAAILGVILGKDDITLYDNSYGKSSAFFDTWLNDVDGLRLVRSDGAKTYYYSPI